MQRDESTGGLVERLCALGIDAREARIYVHLLLSGASRAGDVAAALRLKRTETYRALESLMERGFVTAQLTRPVEYQAVPAEALFAEELARHDQRREDIARTRDELSRAAAETHGPEGGRRARLGYRIVQGRRAIHALTESMLRNMAHGQSMVSTYFSAANATVSNRAYQETLRRARDGVTMQLLVRHTPGIERAVEPFPPSVRIRTFEPQHPMRFTIVDGREVLVWLVSDEEPGLDARKDVAMWTNAPDFVRAQQTLFDALWRNAMDLKR